jgi:hypothetical protein
LLGKPVLRFTGEIEDGKAYIWARVICKKVGIDDDVRFCIDTGAQSTCLLQDDALRIGVETRLLKTLKNKVGGIGGSADMCVMKNVRVRFVSDDGRGLVAPFSIFPIVIQHETMLGQIVTFCRALFLRRKRRRTVLPSLLGFDFLRYCTISFSDTEVYLDIDVKAK